MRVLVTNATYQNALAAVRALGNAGVEVVVAGIRKKGWRHKQGVAFMSRHCAKRAYYTDPAKDMDAYAQDIAGILKTQHIDVLCPIGIKEVMATLRYENDLRPLAKIPFGSFEDVSRANNKVTATRAAEAVCLPVPRTTVVENLGDLDLDQIELPAVVKIAVGAGSQGVWFARERSDLELIKTEIDAHRALHCPQNSSFSNPHLLLVQEFVPGPVHDVCVLAEHGRIRALVTQKRLKTSTFDAGGGVVNITTHIPLLSEYAEKLIKELNYHGVAQLEFKHDSRDGEYKLLEVNAKFWGTLALSIEAGVNFPLLASLMAQGDEFEDQFEYIKDLAYRWRFPKEIISWVRHRRGREGIGTLFRSPAATTLTDWRWNDPVPGLFQILVTIWKLVTYRLSTE